MQTRRTFLKNGVLLCLATGSLLSCATAGRFPDTGKAHWGMIIDMARCTGCQSCMVACKLQSRTVTGMFNTRIEDSEIGQWPEVRIHFAVEQQCIHCVDAPCVKACSTGAAFVHASGLVLTDWRLCDANGACIEACPFEARFNDPRFSGRIDKCDLCINRLAQGLTPACVENCSAGARIFGRFDAPEGEFGRYLTKIESEQSAKIGASAVIIISSRKGISS